ncbi:MAG: PDZ domain-containing protein [Bdellovibrionales bacterium]|nr:PDZ domain-containing protein [Bdellovibrionales bacterium]
MSGYFRFPTVHGNQICFISEDDIWTTSIEGGVARRLTSGVGLATHPLYSPDGKQLVFSSEEEGHREIYVVDATGGEVRRRTYLGSHSHPVAWDPNGDIIFRSRAYHPHSIDELYSLNPSLGAPQPLQVGPATSITYSSQGEIVIERNSHRPDPAHWKLYRGGTAGILWVGENLDAQFSKLLNFSSNFSRPLWIGNRIYFISDHEGVGNIYSCLKDGLDLRKHTHSKDFYCRNPQTDGQHIVYHCGGELFCLNLITDKIKHIDIQYYSQRTQRQRKFSPVKKYLENYKISPKSDQVQITVRGQLHIFKPWEGSVTKLGKNTDSRYRCADWLFNQEKIAVVREQNGKDQVELYETANWNLKEVYENFDFGRVIYLKASPKLPFLGLINNRNEIIVINLETQAISVVDRNEFSYVDSFEWSPDGDKIAFQKSINSSQSVIAIFEVKENKVSLVTKPLLKDFSPSWDPEGKFLYFLSARILDPVYDNMQFELSFPRGIVPCLISLNKETPSPFLINPCEKNELKKQNTSEESEKKKSDNEKDKPLSVKIDFDNIQKRTLMFPVSEGKYINIKGLQGGKVAWSISPIKGAIKTRWPSIEVECENRLEVYDFFNKKAEPVTTLSQFDVTPDYSHFILRYGNNLRLVKTTEKLDEKTSPGEFNKKSGWIHLERVKVLIEPASEWKQMLNEVWQLQKDHFWDPKSINIDWNQIWKNYSSLLDKINTRMEFSDLVWELQGELGTSHAYDIGGDYRPSPHYGVGLLGADFLWDPKKSAYKINKIYCDNSWNENEGSPLAQLGVKAQEGDWITEIQGEVLTEKTPIGSQLLHLANEEVSIGLLKQGESTPHKFLVKTLASEQRTRYLHWVNQNRKYVLENSQGKVGYIHIPDMGPRGFSEFHYGFLTNFDCDALIIDVRFNGGGHVSQLLLEKIARRRLGAFKSRWFGTSSIPAESPAGPLVAITNEFAGSDGDIFSQTFKMRNLGPLIGTRTWGGVVGIWPRHSLVDGSVTTQPEYSSWFADMEWKVENYGVDPTITVELAPHNYRKKQDPQLDRAIMEAMNLLEKNPPFKPNL